MTREDILQLQQKIENDELQKTIHKWDECCQGKSSQEAREILTRLGEENAREVVKQWHNLGYTLIAKYSDGYCNLPDGAEPQNIGYSSKWLALTNYKEGPTSYNMKP